MIREIECPICETHLSVKSKAEVLKVKCPACKNEFTHQNQPQQVVTGSSSVKNKRTPTLSVPTPSGEIHVPKPPAPKKKPKPNAVEEPVTVVNSQSETVEQRSDIDAPSDSESSAPDISDEATSSSALLDVRKRYKKKNKQRTYYVVAGAILFAILITALTAWFVIRVNNIDLFASSTTDDPEAIVEKSDDNSTSAKKNGTNPTKDRQRSTKKKEPEQPVIKKIELAKLPPQKFTFLDERAMERVWSVANPRLLTMKVHRQNRVNVVIGTIVDSRGWVLAPYHQIAGANKVEVIECPKTIDESYSDDLLTDEVRGIIASDASRDLILLAVNLRFVKSLGSLKYGTKTDMVTGQHVVHAAPPTPENPYARIEVDVADRFDQADLPADVLGAVEGKGIIDESNVWIELKQGPEMMPGTTLYTREGKLAGINSFSQGGSSYFVLTRDISNLIQAAATEPAPLSSLFSEKQKQTEQVKQEVHTLVPDESIRSALELVGSHGETCDQFGWIATNEADFEQLQKFAQSMSKIQTFIMRNQKDRKKKQIINRLKEESQRWVDSISMAITKQDNSIDAKISKMAKLSADKLQSAELKDHEQFIPFFGKVFVAGIVSPDPESMFLSVAKSKVYVKAPYLQSGNVLLPDSEWLFFARRQPSRATSNHRIKGTSFNAEAAQLMFSIGPLPSSF